MTTATSGRRVRRSGLATPPLESPPGSAFRPDIEGLRGLAVLLVVAFHAGLPGIQGGFVGVDVFFVISGYLITGLLWGELGRSGRISLSRFYARRVRRLLPLATTVLLFVVLASLVLYPPIDRPAVGADVASAATWWSNWHFAASSVQYMSDVDQSPVLHFWSLSIEEQYYVLWPLLLVALTWFARRRGAAGDGAEPAGRPARVRFVGHTFRIALVVVLVGSFAVSVVTSSTSGPWAYFGLHTRAWELAAGGLLAVAGSPRLSGTVGRLLGFAGLAMILASAVVLDRDTVFPGWSAALPVVGTVLIIATGAATRGGVFHLFASSGMRFLGRMSYGWYLWHWPLLIFAQLLWLRPDGVDVADAPASGNRALLISTGAVLVALAVSVATHHLVEGPVRSSRTLVRMPKATLAVGAALVVLVLAALPIAAGTGSAAAVLPFSPGAKDQPGRMTAAQARADGGLPMQCWAEFAGTTVDPSCTFGDPTGSVVIALIGDSHASHWLPTLDEVAKTHGWRLLFWAKPACGFADVPQFNSGLKREYTECALWRQHVIDRLRSEPRLDAVVIGRSFTYAGGVMDGGKRADARDAVALWGAGAGRTFQELATTKAHIVVLRDTPRPIGDVPSCISAHDAAECAFPRAGHTHLDAELMAAEEAHASGDVTYLDLTDAICPVDPCPVVTPSGVVKYHDSHHLTRTYARSLASALGPLLAPVVTQP